MSWIALVATALAAALHVYIFWLESFAWTGPRGRATFGMSAEQAEQTRELAYNQGFYNLFLAVTALIGAGAWLGGHEDVGRALVLAGCGSMLAAALVLGISSPEKRRAAVMQGTLPLVTVAATLLTLA